MRLNDLKENRKFQIIVCIIIGFLMFFYQIHLEKEYNEIEKEIQKTEDDLKDLLNQFKSI